MAANKLALWRKTLTSTQHVGLDTMCFIYHFADHPDYAPLTQVLFEKIEAGSLKATTSIISLTETLIRPEKENRFDLVLDYEDFFIRLEQLSTLSLDWTLAKLTAKMRAVYPGMRLPDLIQISAALLNRADVFITNDSHFSQIKEIPVMQLSDFVE